MQQTETALSASTTRPGPLGLRLIPSIHLCDGQPVGAFVDTMSQFEETARFGPDLYHSETPSLENHLTRQIRHIAEICETSSSPLRPIIMPVPARVLDSQAILDTCLIAVKQTHLCPQEIAFEFTDASLVRNTGLEFSLFRSLRMRGFRISIDARASQQSQLQPISWLMIDTLRIKAHTIPHDGRLDDMITSATEAGVAIVAEQPKWRDADSLARAGIAYGTQPRADA